MNPAPTPGIQTTMNPPSLVSRSIQIPLWLCLLIPLLGLVLVATPILGLSGFYLYRAYQQNEARQAALIEYQGSHLRQGAKIDSLLSLSENSIRSLETRVSTGLQATRSRDLSLPALNRDLDQIRRDLNKADSALQTLQAEVTRIQQSRQLNPDRSFLTAPLQSDLSRWEQQLSQTQTSTRPRTNPGC
ncbi:MAG: hypothetical protein HC904_15615 [Blastochloris sp.]|nr:hypothetical protein [Blastochloris sp.]